MPEQAPRPIRLIQSHEIMKFRTFTNLNERRKRTIPKKVTIIVRSTTELTGNRLTSHPTKEQTIPDTTNHDATKQSLIFFPNMRRIKELQRAMNIQQRTTTKTLTTAKISSNLVTPGIKNSSPKMLNKASQITKQGQTRPNPSQGTRVPLKANLSSTSRKKMNRTMNRTTLTNHCKQTINPTNLSRPKSKIAPKQAKPKPNPRKKQGHPVGPSSRLRTAPTQAKGWRRDQTTLQTADRSFRKLSEASKEASIPCKAVGKYIDLTTLTLP